NEGRALFSRVWIEKHSGVRDRALTRVLGRLTDPKRAILKKWVALDHGPVFALADLAPTEDIVKFVVNQVLQAKDPETGEVVGTRGTDWRFFDLLPPDRDVAPRNVESRRPGRRRA